MVKETETIFGCNHLQIVHKIILKGQSNCYQSLDEHFDAINNFLLNKINSPLSISGDKTKIRRNLKL
jgi:hypothetical protein